MEILVHISGPSCGRDDERYRTQARGLLDFRPAERYTLYEHGPRDKDGPQETLADRKERVNLRINRQAHKRATQSGQNVETLLFTNERRSRPGCSQRQEKQGKNIQQEEQKLDGYLPSQHILGIERQWGDTTRIDSVAHSDCSPSSSIEEQLLLNVQEDSRRKSINTPFRRQSVVSEGVHHISHNRGVPLKTPPISNSTTFPTVPWTCVKETPRLLIARTPALPRPRTAPEQPKTQEVPKLRRTQSDSWQTPPSTIPDSQPNVQSSSPLEFITLPNLKRPFSSSSPSPTRNSPADAKRPRIEVPSSPPVEEPAANDSPEFPPPIFFSSPLAPPQSSPPTEYCPRPGHQQRYPNQIWPPFPEIGHNKFKTHITSAMIRIETRLPLDEGFKRYVATQTRPLEILERGHWHIPVKNWSDELKTSFWEFLTIYVGEGHAGFGVNAFREMLDSGDGKEEAVTVYCWGEVVGHVWLLLLIGGGSKGLIRSRAGAKWIDALGENVIVMK